MQTIEIVHELLELADILEIAGANGHRVRAFRNGARSLESWQGDLAGLVEAGEVTSIRGIGSSLAAIIEEAVTGGSSAEAAEIRASVPAELLEWLRIPGVGPKKVRAIWEGLGITRIAELEAALRQEQVRGLKGFGPKSEADILAGIERMKKFAGRSLTHVAEEVAARFLLAVESAPGVQRAAIAGSLRRRRETIGDVDILVAAEDGEPARAAFLGSPGIESVAAEGRKKCRVVSSEGIGVDLRIVAPIEFPAALHYFTGSKEHNTRLRQLAKDRGWKLNEYGLWRVADGDAEDERIETADEDAIFRALDLAPVPPELREDLGEVEQGAETESFPTLVEVGDLRGILHNHSTWSDGRNSLREMVEAARSKGWEYYGTADHSRTASYAGGLSIAELREQRAEVDALNEEFDDITILHGIESDILPDGSLDYPDEVLAELDYVVASVHANFSLDRETQTARIERALRSPFTTVWGHPTGRLLLRRDPYDCDMEHLLSVAAEEGVIVEINASPHRLDLDWRWGGRVRDLGVEVGIHPDAHSIAGIDDVRHGIGVARKAGLTSEQVTNTWPIERYLERLRARRNRAGIS
ncbi:MAG: DNA polymerase/3'-5' exonuclease PolX [Planctomycetota bacterium]|jgi:DNA polymerase (family 10)